MIMRRGTLTIRIVYVMMMLFGFGDGIKMQFTDLSFAPILFLQLFLSLSSSVNS